jgi:hypothetical protein
MKLGESVGTFCQIFPPHIRIVDEVRWPIPCLARGRGGPRCVAGGPAPHNLLRAAGGDASEGGGQKALDVSVSTGRLGWKMLIYCILLYCFGFLNSGRPGCWQLLICLVSWKHAIYWNHIQTVAQWFDFWKKGEATQSGDLAGSLQNRIRRFQPPLSSSLWIV